MKHIRSRAGNGKPKRGKSARNKRRESEREKAEAKKEEVKLGYLQLDWCSKLQALREAKDKQNLGKYLTLVTWLDETPTRFGGMPLRYIPDDVYWKLA
jgi:hypothetical protein